MDKKKKLSELLRTKRHSMKMTQEQAAELLDISARWYRRIESGNAKPGFSLICEIAHDFDIDFGLLSDKNEKTS